MFVACSYARSHHNFEHYFVTVFIFSYIMTGEKARERKGKKKNHSFLVSWDLEEVSHLELLFRISEMLFSQKKQRALVGWG